jgi:hypothetical protein
MLEGTVVTISSWVASFTAVCELCAALESHPGSTGSTFAGRLDLDLHDGMFLCLRGHPVRVERADPEAEKRQSAA